VWTKVIPFRHLPYIFHIKPFIFITFSWSHSLSDFHEIFSIKMLKSIFKRGYEEIRDRKFLGILKKDRTWLKYELHCNVKMSAPLFFQNNLTFVIQMLINIFPQIVFVRTFFLAIVIKAWTSQNSFVGFVPLFFTIPWLVCFYFLTGNQFYILMNTITGVYIYKFVVVWCTR
jgi:hypothetical protein